MILYILSFIRNLMFVETNIFNLKYFFITINKQIIVFFLTCQSDSFILLPFKPVKYFAMEEPQILQEPNISFLKQKCNMLIEKALQLEQEKKDNDLKICRLQEEKEILEEELKEQSTSHTVKIPEQVFVPAFTYEVSEIQPSEQETEQVSPEKVLTMIQSVSMQNDIQPEEENSTGHITIGKKILNFISGILRGNHKNRQEAEERAIREETDKEYLNLKEQEVIIIYEDKSGQKIVRFILLLVSIAVIGVIIYGLMYTLTI